MKNLFLIIFCACIFFPAISQEEIQIPYNQFLFEDTVILPLNGKYYLYNFSKDELNHHSVIRKIDNSTAIINGSQNDFLQSGKNYYLLHDTWKLSSRLSAMKLPLFDEHIFSIKLTKNIDLESLYYNNIEVLRVIKNANIAIVRTTFAFIKNKLIKNDSVLYIDLAKKEPVEESPIRQYNLDLNRITTAQHNYPNLKGDGMVISIKEHSINDEDIDLTGKVIINEYSSLNFTQHAKEMGTLIAGLGNSFKTGKGVVPRATLISTDFSLQFAEDESYYNNHNIKVQNHSYGSDIENFYQNESISYDQSSVDQPELMHVFSAGNSGTLAPNNGIYAGLTGYANLTGAYKQAKNTLVVSALDSAGNHVTQSSSGPTYDGRIKPELAAFGGEGSSESAALASGCVAMLQQHYFNLHGAYPTSSLVKSLLIAGADEAHNSGIDFKTGYGSINVNRSLQLLDSGWHYEGILNSNDSDSFQISVPSNVKELKVVVSWIDPPANPEDATALVNDLDMIIKSPAGEITFPWILNTSPNVIALAATATQGEDHLNPVEMISINNPETGIYTMDISSNILEGTKQHFSIAYYIKYYDFFQWNFPTSDDYLQAGTSPYLRWENSYQAQGGNILIKYGNGDWEPIGQVDVGKEQFKYTLKDTTIFARLRMDVSGKEYRSDTFTVTKLLKINIENDCESDFTLSWGMLENVSDYTLFELHDNELLPILSVSDTVLILDKSAYSKTYYAIQPNHSKMLPSLRSYAVNYKNRNQGCYISNFLAFLDLDKFANIQLSINVPYEVQEVVIKKEFQGNTEVFKQFSPDGENHFIFEDHDLIPGRYTYSAELLLYEGKKILSDSLSLFYTDQNAIIVFPNPVYDDFVNILNDYSGGVIQLFDKKGAFIKSYDLVNTVDTIDLTGLDKGLFLFRIIYQGQIVNAGKIIRL